MHPIPRPTKRLALAALLCGLVAVPMLVSARPGQGRDQGRRGPPSEAEREAFHGKMKARMAKVLRQDVGLDEARAKQVEAIFARQHASTKQLRESLHTHHQALRALLESDSNDQAAYSKALDGIEAAHKGLRAQRERGIAEARKILNPKEQAKMLRAMHKARRHHFGKRGRGRRGHGGPGHGGPDHDGPDHDGPGQDAPPPGDDDAEYDG